MANISMERTVRGIADVSPENRAQIILRARRLRAEAMVEAFAQLARWISRTCHRLFDTSFGLPKTR